MSTRPSTDREELSDLDREIDAFLDAEEYHESMPFADPNLMPAPLVPRKRVDGRLYVDSAAVVGAIPVADVWTFPRTRDDSLSPESSTWRRRAPESKTPANDIRRKYQRVEALPDSRLGSSNCSSSPPSQQWPYADPGNPPDWRPFQSRSCFSREQRLAYIRALQSRHLGSSSSSLAECQMDEADGYALPIEQLEVEFASSNELPHTVKHRPFLPPRSPPQLTIHHDPVLGGALVATRDVASVDLEHCQRNAWDHARKIPDTTSRVYNPSASVPKGEAFRRQRYASPHHDEDGSLGPFDKESEPVKDRAQAYLDLLEDSVPSSSSTSSGQTRRPPSATEPPTPMLSHMQDFEALRHKAYCQDATCIKAEKEAHMFALGGNLVAQAGIPFERIRQAVIQLRLKQGLQKPKGFFGLHDVDAERQANFELALDRLDGKIPDEYSAHDWLEAERARAARRPERDLWRRQSVREGSLAGLRKYLGHR